MINLNKKRIYDDLLTAEAEEGRSRIKYEFQNNHVFFLLSQWSSGRIVPAKIIM